MRILYLANSAHIGGGNRSLLALWEELAERGHELVTAVPEAGPLVAEAAAKGVTPEIVPFAQPSWRKPIDTWSGVRRWQKLLRQHRPDIVHANGLHGGRSIGIAASRVGLPVVVHVRFGMLREREKFMEWAFHRMPKPDHFILNSHSLLAEMRSHLERASPTTPTTVVHNPISLVAFSPRPAHRQRGSRIGIIANLLPVKGHVDFLQMAGRLRDRGYESDFFIAGTDLGGRGYDDSLLEACRALDLENRVHFLGHVPDIPELLRTLDVVVCPSHVEPFGRSVAEAMSCQVPVVTTDVGGLPEVVEEGVTGFLVPPQSPDLLADRVARLLEDPDLRQRMGEAGRARVQRLFSTTLHADRILAIYAELVSAASRHVTR